MLYRIRNVTFAYSGQPVLRGVDLDIAPGDFISVIGPNGAGKSTLLKLMAGLITRFAGEITFEDRPITTWRPSDLASRLAFVPQETHVVFPFTAAEMVMMGIQERSGHFFDPDSAIEASHTAMALTGTEALHSRVFSELSGGERQRIVLASALVQKPRVLLLDEPTVYLDLKHQLGFYDILGRLSREGMTIVAVTHDVNLAARFAKRIVVLSGGRIDRSGTPEEVLTPELFSEVFEVTAEVVERPEGGRYVVPAV